MLEVRFTKRKGNLVKEKCKPKWQKHFEERIRKLQRKIAHVNIILNSRTENIPLTTNQRKIQVKLKRCYGNTKTETLTSRLVIFKHELHVTSTQMKRRQQISERERINKRFATNQKNVYRNWKSKQIKVKDPAPPPPPPPPPLPRKEEIETFWKDIWEKKTGFNENAEWLGKLEEGYCVDATSKHYEMTMDTFQQVLKKMKNNGAPGYDHIKSFWVKKLTSTHLSMLDQFTQMFEGTRDTEERLPLCRTILMPKKNGTKLAKNYRPIACLNITYKIFTDIVYSFFEDHCTSNDIITLEQAGGKRVSWGCTDQLLINKMVQEEVIQHRNWNITRRLSLANIIYPVH